MSLGESGPLMKKLDDRGGAEGITSGNGAGAGKWGVIVCPHFKPARPSVADGSWFFEKADKRQTAKLVFTFRRWLNLPLRFATLA